MGVATKEILDFRTKEVLMTARELYAERPSHAPRGEFTNHCPVRCIDRASGGRNDAATRALASAAGLLDWCTSARGEIIDWNAESSTETVLAAFDRAIAAADDP